MFDFWRRKRRLKADCVTASEKGLVRKENQDSFFVDESKTVFCVADGMGGGAEGATASRIVCEEIGKAVADVTDLVCRMRAVVEAIAAANVRIRSYAAERGFRLMGSTLAALLVDPDDGRCAAICHVGDSRVYRVRQGAVALLTHDHTVGGQLSALAPGAETAEMEHRSHPLAHVLTRAIGAEENVTGEWRRIDLEAGDRYLVCSDGVHDVVDDSLIGEILAAGGDLPSASKRLDDEVVRNGAPDNYTFVIVKTGGAT